MLRHRALRRFGTMPSVTALEDVAGLPVVHHAVQRCFVPEVCEQLAEPILPLDIYMKKPWEITMEEDI